MKNTQLRPTTRILSLFQCFLSIGYAQLKNSKSFTSNYVIFTNLIKLNVTSIITTINIIGIVKLLAEGKTVKAKSAFKKIRFLLVTLLLEFN